MGVSFKMLGYNAYLSPLPIFKLSFFMSWCFLYATETVTLPDMQGTDIVSHSPGCLFTFG